MITKCRKEADRSTHSVKDGAQQCQIGSVRACKGRSDKRSVQVFHDPVETWLLYCGVPDEERCLHGRMMLCDEAEVHFCTAVKGEELLRMSWTDFKENLDASLVRASLKLVRSQFFRLLWKSRTRGLDTSRGVEWRVRTLHFVVTLFEQRGRDLVQKTRLQGRVSQMLSLLQQCHQLLAAQVRAAGSGKTEAGLFGALGRLCA